MKEWLEKLFSSKVANLRRDNTRLSASNMELYGEREDLRKTVESRDAQIRCLEQENAALLNIVNKADKKKKSKKKIKISVR